MQRTITWLSLKLAQRGISGQYLQICSTCMHTSPILGPRERFRALVKKKKKLWAPPPPLPH